MQLKALLISALRSVRRSVAHGARRSCCDSDNGAPIRPPWVLPKAPSISKGVTAIVGSGSCRLDFVVSRQRFSSSVAVQSPQASQSRRRPAFRLGKINLFRFTDAARARIYVESIVPQEANQCDPETQRRFDRKAGRSFRRPPTRKPPPWRFSEATQNWSGRLPSGRNRVAAIGDPGGRGQLICRQHCGAPRLPAKGPDFHARKKARRRAALRSG